MMGKKPKPLLYLSLLALIVLFYLGWKALAYPVQTVPVISQLDSMPPVPGMEEVPQGPEGDLIKKGYLYMVDTANQLPQYVGNKLSCSSCHADGGTGANLNLVGVNRIFPQYNSRSGQNIVLEDRIQQCFERSMAGTAPAKDSEEMKAMVAYINYISKNVPEGTKKRPWVVAPAIKGQLPSQIWRMGRNCTNWGVHPAMEWTGRGMAEALRWVLHYGVRIPLISVPEWGASERLQVTFSGICRKFKWGFMRPVRLPPRRPSISLPIFFQNRGPIWQRKRRIGRRTNNPMMWLT
ncbi:exported hypothetical protein [[Clostridium] ultunense Esp]|nr:exported hypothetical protein [[Clostridium] ultunense Esp]